MCEQYYFIQYFLSLTPIRLAACQKGIKRLGMIMVFQVAKLMHDDVLNTVNGCFYQVYVECDTTLRAAASPAPAHVTDR